METSKPQENQEKIIAENPNLRVKRGEAGEITFGIVRQTEYNSFEFEKLIVARLESIPDNSRIGMKITTVDSQDGTISTINITPVDNSSSRYEFTSENLEFKPDETLAIVRGGIKLLDAFLHSTPEQKTRLFDSKDPDDPAEIAIVEDNLRDDADYSISGFKGLRPEDVVERLASRKKAREIGLSTKETDPFPSEYLTLMNALMSQVQPPNN